MSRALLAPAEKSGNHFEFLDDTQQQKVSYLSQGQIRRSFFYLKNKNSFRFLLLLFFAQTSIFFMSKIVCCNLWIVCRQINENKKQKLKYHKHFNLSGFKSWRFERPRIFWSLENREFSCSAVTSTKLSDRPSDQVRNYKLSMNLLNYFKCCC